MKRRISRLIFGFGVACLAGLYVFPLWKISLGVPQYPKEIAIHIRINEIRNGTEKALEIMNVLNHNIGMKKIDPGAIPELSYFPWILAGIIVLGFLSLVPENNIFRIAWIALLLLALALALYDFYLWQYEYGHNLEPDAPIKIENSSFQPPLIGKKRIANFIVKSIPMAGAIFPVLSLGLTLVALKIKK